MAIIAIPTLNASPNPSRNRRKLGVSTGDTPMGKSFGRLEFELPAEAYDLTVRSEQEENDPASNLNSTNTPTGTAGSRYPVSSLHRGASQTSTQYGQVDTVENRTLLRGRSPMETSMGTSHRSSW